MFTNLAVYPSNCLSIHLYIWYLAIFLFLYLSGYLSVYLSAYFSNRQVYLFSCFIYLSICLAIGLFIYLSIYLSIWILFCLSVYLTVSLSICQSNSLFICLSLNLFVCLSIRLCLALDLCLVWGNTKTFNFILVILIHYILFILQLYLSCLSPEYIFWPVRTHIKYNQNCFKIRFLSTPNWHLYHGQIYMQILCSGSRLLDPDLSPKSLGRFWYLFLEISSYFLRQFLVCTDIIFPYSINVLRFVTMKTFILIQIF